MNTKSTILYSILLTIVAITISCENVNKAELQKIEKEEIYVNQFKLTYFRLLLSKSYNNSNSVRDIISNDHSGFTEPILTDIDFKLIDSLTTIDNQRLITDSSEGHLRAEGAQGKRPLGFIMDILTSKWLDSLSKSRMKISGVSDNWSD